MVHCAPFCWTMPVILFVSGLLCLVTPETRVYATAPMSLYIAGKVASDHFDLLSDTTQDVLKRRFQSAFMAYFRLQHLTPSVVVSVENWERPQVIMSGPHGVFNLGGIRSIMTATHEDKKIICAIAPAMGYMWFDHILRMGGIDGMMPLQHQSIQNEMVRASRDIMVITGGFIETNTGNENFATMSDDTWDYWLLQCLRHGYDASFQWIHGATQVYHTGSVGIQTRLLCGKLGIPCMVPSGQYHTPMAHNDVQMSVCSFRLPVECVPDASRTSPEFLGLVQEFRSRGTDLIARYPPKTAFGQAPLKMISSL